MTKHRGWTSLAWSSHLEGSIGKHPGSSMRPPSVPLVCGLQYMEERHLHKSEGDNVLECKVLK